MALVLIKEDGTGRSDANSYASVADADAYCEGNPWSIWSQGDATVKTKALVLATRLIDAMYQFNGGKANSEQALQWPRVRCPDPDAPGWTSVLTWAGRDRCVPEDVVPSAVVQATCEMAKELCLVDRTAPPPGEGLDSVSETTMTRDYNETTSGTTSYTSQQSTAKKYSKSDTRPIMSRVAQAMLSKYGSLVSGGGVARVIRV